MTLHELLNTCNADPDIEITVYKSNNSFFPEHVYEGKYEELNNPQYLHETVSCFFADKLNDKGYRTDISHMTIFLK